MVYALGKPQRRFQGFDRVTHFNHHTSTLGPVQSMQLSCTAQSLCRPPKLGPCTLGPLPPQEGDGRVSLPPGGAVLPALEMPCDGNKSAPFQQPCPPSSGQVHPMSHQPSPSSLVLQVFLSCSSPGAGQNHPVQCLLACPITSTPAHSRQVECVVLHNTALTCSQHPAHKHTTTQAAQVVLNLLLIRDHAIK